MAITDFYEHLQLIHEDVTVDEYGTHKETYRSVLEFKGGIIRKKSPLIYLAEKPATDTEYTLVTSKEVPVEFNNIIYRNNTKCFYRIVSDLTESPSVANLNAKQYTLRKVNINVI